MAEALQAVSADKEPRTERGRRTPPRAHRRRRNRVGENASTPPQSARSPGAPVPRWAVSTPISTPRRDLPRARQRHERARPRSRRPRHPRRGRRPRRRARRPGSFLGFVRDHRRSTESSTRRSSSTRRASAATMPPLPNASPQRLREAATRGELRADVEEVHAWAVMGMNVFLGLRYGGVGRGSADQRDSGRHRRLPAPRPGPVTPPRCGRLRAILRQRLSQEIPDHPQRRERVRHGDGLVLPRQQLLHAANRIALAIQRLVRCAAPAPRPRAGSNAGCPHASAAGAARSASPNSAGYAAAGRCRATARRWCGTRLPIWRPH